MLLRAHQPIPVLLLPQCPAPSQQLVDFLRGKALPTVRDFLQGMFSKRPEQRVNMVRHHYEGSHFVAIAVKVEERVRHDLSNRRLPQAT